MQLYGVPFFATAKDFLLQVAMIRGKLKRVRYCNVSANLHMMRQHIVIPNDSQVFKSLMRIDRHSFFQSDTL